VSNQKAILFVVSMGRPSFSSGISC
jgi:hypothetical protein